MPQKIQTGFLHKETSPNPGKQAKC